MTVVRGLQLDLVLLDKVEHALRVVIKPEGRVMPIGLPPGPETVPKFRTR